MTPMPRPLVFGFDQPVNGGGASLTGTITFSGSEMIVQLVGITDAQTVTVNALNVTTPDGAVLPSVSVQIGFLNGDVNGNGSVTSSDIARVKSSSGAAVNGANFRNDVTANGSINSADITLVKSRSGSSLPTGADEGTRAAR